MSSSSLGAPLDCGALSSVSASPLLLPLLLALLLALLLPLLLALLLALPLSLLPALLLALRLALSLALLLRDALLVGLLLLPPLLSAASLPACSLVLPLPLLLDLLLPRLPELPLLLDESDRGASPSSEYFSPLSSDPAAFSASPEELALDLPRFLASSSECWDAPSRPPDSPSSLLLEALLCAEGDAGKEPEALGLEL